VAKYYHVVSLKLSVDEIVGMLGTFCFSQNTLSTSLLFFCAVVTLCLHIVVSVQYFMLMAATSFVAISVPLIAQVVVCCCWWIFLL